MTVPFFEATAPARSRARVFLSYLAYYRAQVVTRLTGMPAAALRESRLPSGWTPIELLQHLTWVERRWLEWGFEGRDIGDPWGDSQDGHWHVPASLSLAELIAALEAQAARTEEIVDAHKLADQGQPGERWDGADPASLERVLFHLLQEDARHTGQLDIVSELAGGPTGE
jgi:uncharacterized damage-inducible protein DinB